MLNTSPLKLKRSKIKYKTHTWDGPGMQQYVQIIKGPPYGMELTVWIII